MGVTKVDLLFEEALALLKEISEVEEGDHGLDIYDLHELDDVRKKLEDMQESYLDRMISETIIGHDDPVGALQDANIDPGHLERAMERVRASLVERGVPLAPPKKNLLN
jgi:hypothetical protein